MSTLIIGTKLTPAASAVIAASPIDGAYRRGAVLLGGHSYRAAGFGPIAGGTTGNDQYTFTRSTLQLLGDWGADGTTWLYNIDGSTQSQLAAISGTNSASGAPLTYGGAINPIAYDAATVNGTSYGASAFVQDWAGNNWAAAVGTPTRPVNGQPPASTAARIPAWEDMATMLDANVLARNIDYALQHKNAGAVSIQMDDCKEWVSFLNYTYKSTAIETAFYNWIIANKTSAQWQALGLPATLPVNTVISWVTTNAGSPWLATINPSGLGIDIGSTAFQALFSPSAVDLRFYQLFSLDGWFGDFWREKLNAAYTAIKAASGLPLSGNAFKIDSDHRSTWVAPALDFIQCEFIQPVYNSGFSDAQNLQQRLNEAAAMVMAATTCDVLGKRLIAVQYPGPLGSVGWVQNPASWVIATMRQNLATWFALGATAKIPFDQYMQAASGTSVDGYSYLPGTALYKDLFDFVRTIRAASIDNTKSIGDIGFLFSANYTPQIIFNGEIADFNLLISRLRVLLDAGLQPIAVIDGNQWVQQDGRTRAAALPYVYSASGASDFRTAQRCALLPNVETGAVNTSLLQSRFANVWLTGAGAASVRAYSRLTAAGKMVIHLVNYGIASFAQSTAVVSLAGPFATKSFNVQTPSAPTAVAYSSSVSVYDWAVLTEV